MIVNHANRNRVIIAVDRNGFDHVVRGCDPTKAQTCILFLGARGAVKGMGDGDILKPQTDRTEENRAFFIWQWACTNGQFGQIPKHLGR